MRRKFVYDKESGEMVEVDPYSYVPVGSQRITDSVLWGDRNYDGLLATDGTDISTRTKHRDYMRTHGLAHESDFVECRRRGEEQRRNILNGVDPGRKIDIAKAIAELNSRKK